VVAVAVVAVAVVAVAVVAADMGTNLLIHND
jgi:hypothetical protein